MDFEVGTWDVSQEANDLNNSLFRTGNKSGKKKKKASKLIETERKDVLPEKLSIEKNFTKTVERFGSDDAKDDLTDKPGKKRKRKRNKDSADNTSQPGKQFATGSTSNNTDTARTEGIQDKQISAKHINEPEDERDGMSSSKKKRKPKKKRFEKLDDAANDNSNKDLDKNSLEIGLTSVDSKSTENNPGLKRKFSDFSSEDKVGDDHVIKKKKKRKNKKNKTNQDNLTSLNKHENVNNNSKQLSMDALNTENAVKLNKSEETSGALKQKPLKPLAETLKDGLTEGLGNKKKKKRNKKKNKTSDASVSEAPAETDVGDSIITSKPTQKSSKQTGAFGKTDRKSQQTNKSPTLNRQKLLQILDKHDKSLNKNAGLTNRTDKKQGYTQKSNSPKTPAKDRQKLKHKFSESDSDDESVDDSDVDEHELTGNHSKNEKKKVIETNKKVANETTKKSLLQQNRERLEAARFRFINEQLYVRTGAEALEMFNADRDAFTVYHKGFQNQVEKWPVNPLDVIIDFVKSQPEKKVVADFGCGDAKLAQSVQNKVHSFDLVAVNKYITVCDISKVPLPDSSVDIAVFCLSLMGTNFASYLQEANRVLKKGGTLVIAEVTSRFAKLNAFIGDVMSLGFHPIDQDTENSLFVLMKFQKKTDTKDKVIRNMKLKPCLYKKR